MSIEPYQLALLCLGVGIVSATFGLMLGCCLSLSSRISEHERQERPSQ